MNNIEIIIDEKTGELIDAKILIQSIVNLNELPIEIQVGDKTYKTDVEGEPEVVIKGIPFFTCSVKKVNFDE